MKINAEFFLGLTSKTAVWLARINPWKRYFLSLVLVSALSLPFATTYSDLQFMLVLNLVFARIVKKIIEVWMDFVIITDKSLLIIKMVEFADDAGLSECRQMLHGLKASVSQNNDFFLLKLVSPFLEMTEEFIKLNEWKGKI
jgi:hypothetical protein